MRRVADLIEDEYCLYLEPEVYPVTGVMTPLEWWLSALRTTVRDVTDPSRVVFGPAWDIQRRVLGPVMIVQWGDNRVVDGTTTPGFAQPLSASWYLMESLMMLHLDALGFHDEGLEASPIRTDELLAQDEFLLRMIDASSKLKFPYVSGRVLREINCVLSRAIWKMNNHVAPTFCLTSHPPRCSLCGNPKLIIEDPMICSCCGNKDWNDRNRL